MSGVTGMSGARREFGQGTLSRAAALVYGLLVVEILLLVTTLPGLVPLLLLDRDAGNLPLAAVCLIPVGPALSAAVYAVHHRSEDLTDLRPAAGFWRGYRLNVAAALRIWVPALAWLTVLAVGVGRGSAAGMSGWWSPVLIVIAAVVTLWAANALVITSLFVFRTRDVARLAAYFLVRTPGVPVGTVCLLIVAGGLTAVASEAAVVLLASVFVLALVRTSRPMVTAVREDFTA
jgi:hypothetical protein